MKFYSDKFREIRKQKKISLTELGRRTGLTRAALWTWETNRISPSEKKIRLAAKALDVPVSMISDLSDNIPISNSKEYQHTFSLFAPLSSEKVKEREKRQTWHVENILKEFKDLNQVITVIKALMNSIDVMFYVKDLSLKYITVNQAFLKNVSLDGNYSATGKTDEDFFPEKEARQNSEEDEYVILSGKEIKNREGYIPGSRKKKWGIISKIPVFDSDEKATGIVGYFSDITARKKAEMLNEELVKGLNIMDETIWMAAKAKERPGGGIIFEDYLYAVDTKFKKRLIEESGLSLEGLGEYADTLRVDKDPKHNLNLLKENRFSEIKYKIKFPSEQSPMNLDNKVYYDPETNLFVGIAREDKEEERIEKIIEKLRKCGMDEDTIKEITS